MIKAEWTNADALDLQPTCNQLATDTISRQAAIDALKVCATIGRGNGKSVAFKIANNYADIVRKRIEELPSAQHTTCKYWDTESDFCTLYRPSAQPEIITCKDCKHGMYDVMCKFYWCHGVAHSANWYCADAERRNDGV